MKTELVQRFVWGVPVYRQRFSLVATLQRLALDALALGRVDFRITRQRRDHRAQARHPISKHLAILKHARVVSSARVGRENLYVIRPDVLHEARHYLERAAQQWDEAVQRLKRLVEN